MTQSLADRLVRLGLADAPTPADPPPATQAGGTASADPPKHVSAKADIGSEATKQPAASGPVDPTFIEPRWFKRLAFAMRYDKGASLFGPRGCGKSSAANELARRTGNGIVLMTCGANMQFDELRGTWSAESGSTKWLDGRLVEALRKGHWLLAEEANVVNPAVWSMVNNLTDDTGHGISLPTGEVVPRHPKFRLLLLYNEGYAGTREVNQATKERLMPIYCDYMAAEDEKSLLAKRTGAPLPVCNNLVQLARMIRSGKVRMDFSPRSMIRMIKMVGLGGFSWGEAYTAAALDLAGSADIAAAQRTLLAEYGKQVNVEQWPMFMLPEPPPEPEPAAAPAVSAKADMPSAIPREDQ